jgi:Na+/melibiose symporter-like transporter
MLLLALILIWKYPINEEKRIEIKEKLKYLRNK